MSYGDEEDQNELMELYASESDVEAATREKEAGDTLIKDAGVLIKDYPNPQRNIDLHGHTGVEAMRELENFINHSINQRVRTVRVITGKGLHSKHMKSVLPELTEKKLSKMKLDNKVITWKRQKDGGAFIVYLT